MKARFYIRAMSEFNSVGDALMSDALNRFRDSDSQVSVKSWTDSLDDKWNAYIVFRTDTRGDDSKIATVYREDFAYEFAKILNDQFDIPAWWSPDLNTGMRRER